LDTPEGGNAASGPENGPSGHLRPLGPSLDPPRLFLLASHRTIRKVGDVEDRIEALEALHSSDDDLHFRFIGTAKDRQFIINIQFDAQSDTTGERLRAEEYDFMILKLLRMVVSHVDSRPNPALN